MGDTVFIHRPAYQEWTHNGPHHGTVDPWATNLYRPANPYNIQPLSHQPCFFKLPRNVREAMRNGRPRFHGNISTQRHTILPNTAVPVNMGQPLFIPKGTDRDMNTNHLKSAYDSVHSCGQLTGTEGVVTLTHPYRTSSKRTHDSKTCVETSVSRTVKRIRGGKIVRLRHRPIRNEKKPKVSNCQAVKDVNNSKPRRDSRREPHVPGAGEKMTVYMMPASPYASVPPQPMATPGFGQTPLFMRVGNPSLAHGKTYMNISPVGGANPGQNPCHHSYNYDHYHPHHHYHHHQWQTDNSSGTAPKGGRRIKFLGHLSYKPMCQEYPPGLGCGRWYRLQAQEDAKRNGIVPLLRAMFCCCCDDDISQFPAQHVA